MTIKDINRVEKYIKRELNKFKKSHVEVGIRDDSLNANNESILFYATQNELGNSRIPARSFIRSTADEKKNEWMDLVQKEMENLFDLRASNAKVALSRIGIVARDDIKDKISSNVKPENADSTKLQKLSSYLKGLNKEQRAALKANPSSLKTTTLIDTGAMRQAVNYKTVGV